MIQVPVVGGREFLIKTTENGFIMDFKNKFSYRQSQKVYTDFTQLIADLAYEMGLLEVGEKSNLRIVVHVGDK
jgi:hypothetical protein